MFVCVTVSRSNVWECIKPPGGTVIHALVANVQDAPVVSLEMPVWQAFKAPLWQAPFKRYDVKLNSEAPVIVVVWLWWVGWFVGVLLFASVSVSCGGVLACSFLCLLLCLHACFVFVPF